MMLRKGSLVARGRKPGARRAARVPLKAIGCCYLELITVSLGLAANPVASLRLLAAGLRDEGNSRGISLKAIFEIRRRVARIGSSDRLRWWDSKALTPAGLYALEQLFRHTAQLTAADLAIRAARLRHDRVVPRERLVHLFNFGEAFEGSFERWLIDRKREAWAPPFLADEPRAAALRDLDVAGVDSTLEEQGGCVVLGTISSAVLGVQDSLLRTAGRLAATYARSAPGRLVVPYFRLTR